MRKSILLYLSNTFHLSVWHRSSIQLPMRRPHLYINRFPFPHCTRTTHGWTEIIPRWRDRSVAHCALTLRRSAHATGEYKLMYYIYTYTLYMYVYRQSCVPLVQNRDRGRETAKVCGLDMHNMAFIATKHLRTLLDSLMYPTRRRSPWGCSTMYCIETIINKLLSTLALFTNSQLLFIYSKMSRIP